MYKKQRLTICMYWVTLETTPLFLFLMTLLIYVLPLEANGLFINWNIFSHNNSFSIHYICMFKEGFTLPVRICKSAWSNVSWILHGKNFLNSQCLCTPLLQLPLKSCYCRMQGPHSMSSASFPLVERDPVPGACTRKYSSLIHQSWTGWNYCTYRHPPKHCWDFLLNLGICTIPQYWILIQYFSF